MGKQQDYNSASAASASTRCVLLLALLVTLPLVAANCYFDPEDNAATIKAAGNKDVCEHYNGKGACFSCANLDSSVVSLGAYSSLLKNISFDCGAPSGGCQDYMLGLLCGMHCSPYIIQIVDLVPEEDNSTSAETVPTPQKTVCQTFADRMWEHCSGFKVRDAVSGECKSLKTLYTNAKEFYGNLDGGYTVWAALEGIPIDNCFNSAPATHPLLPLTLTLVLSLLLFSSTL